MDDDMTTGDRTARDRTAGSDVDRLRRERDDWRRRAEVAEAVAAERLARAEAAERALATAEAALTRSVPPVPPAAPAAGSASDQDHAAPAPRPRSLLERWRRYTDTIN